MIKLTNGFEVEYNENFDIFFENLLSAIVSQSQKEATTAEKGGSPKIETDLFVQKVMDNCIYVTHQLFEIYKEDEKMTKFIITGFLFNSVILVAPKISQLYKKDSEEEGTIH